ncbi:cyd operon YbgE family protein [Litchfieldella xinjiangensis]|uniref:cyd operon YbgE family protein n=1 Tax=Litchfieldella xinjiangensis TaxID=1166948 RepID=UPI0012E0AA70|nr:cyd operon YbgE family protein [Halomonas xinjiangensis]
MTRLLYRLPWSPMLAMVLSATMAVGLLWWPDLLTQLSMPMRFPLILLGVWALGAGFTQGMGLEPRASWLRWLVSEPLSWGLLVSFALVLVWRALVLFHGA